MLEGVKVSQKLSTSEITPKNTLIPDQIELQSALNGRSPVFELSWDDMITAKKEAESLEPNLTFLREQLDQDANFLATPHIYFEKMQQYMEARTNLSYAWDKVGVIISDKLNLPNSLEYVTPDAISQAIDETHPDLKERLATRNFILWIVGKQLEGGPMNYIHAGSIALKLVNRIIEEKPANTGIEPLKQYQRFAHRTEQILENMRIDRSMRTSLQKRLQTAISTT